MAFLCVSQQGAFKNTIKNVLGGNPHQKLLAEKVERKKILSSFPFDFFGRVFWPFLCMRNPKSPLKCFLKSDRKISKKIKKRQAGM
jgi:hypothetical protein